VRGETERNVKHFEMIEENNTPCTIKQSQCDRIFLTKKIYQMSPLRYGATSVNNANFLILWWGCA